VCPSCHAPLDLDTLVDRLLALRSRVDGVPRAVDVTPREQAVLEALLQGYRTHQIALLLGISSHTVRKHLRSLYVKADCASQADLVSWARSRRVCP
jgi:DNA-binding CsgD family transcriptional regulator